MSDPQTALIEFIAEDLLDDEETITADTSLFKSGLLDSINLSELIVFVEEEFGVRVNAIDVVYDNFDSVGRIAQLVARLKAK